MTPTAARDLCWRLAADQPAQALDIARTINDLWFRCQALSCVGRYWPDEKFDRILGEAIRSADHQDNTYKRVAVSAWPIRAYLERGNSALPKKHLATLISAADGIENMGGRSEAIFHLFQAARPFASTLWQPVFWALVSASEPALSWRQLRNMRDAIAMVAKDHPELVPGALQKLVNEKNIAAIKRYLENLDTGQVSPRSYY